MGEQYRHSPHIVLLHEQSPHYNNIITCQRSNNHEDITDVSEAITRSQETVTQQAEVYGVKEIKKDKVCLLVCSWVPGRVITLPPTLDAVADATRKPMQTMASPDVTGSPHHSQPLSHWWLIDNLLENLRKSQQIPF